jgi:hypothetical protein
MEKEVKLICRLVMQFVFPGGRFWRLGADG